MASAPSTPSPSPVSSSLALVQPQGLAQQAYSAVVVQPQQHPRPHLPKPHRKTSPKADVFDLRLSNPHSSVLRLRHLRRADKRHCWAND